MAAKKNITIHYVTHTPDQHLNLPPSILFDSVTQNGTHREIYITPPYLHPELNITYQDSSFIDQAQAYSQAHSLDQTHPTGTVLVANQQIIAKAANGSNYHEQHGCVRQQKKIPSGQGYELCEGCHPKNHSEARAVLLLTPEQQRLNLTAYLWGHWWCCEYCSQHLIGQNITNITLSKSWTQDFAGIDPTFLQ